MTLQPHTKCCGCCCGLQIGVVIGCSLFILLYGMNIGASFVGRAPDPALAKSFCEDLSLEYRSGYNDCYGTDVCMCGEVPCDFEDMQAEINAAGSISMIVAILAELVLVGAIIGAAQHREQPLKVAVRTVAPLPLLFLLATAIVSAAAEALSRLTAADQYWFRAAADQVCYGNAGSLDTSAHGYENVRYDCSDSDLIGPPSPGRGRGASGSGTCNAAAGIPLGIAGRFIYTVLFNVILLAYLNFNLWSLYKMVASPQPRRHTSSSYEGERGTQMQQIPPAIGQPVAVATCVTAPIASSSPDAGDAPPPPDPGSPAVAIATRVMPASPGAGGASPTVVAAGTPVVGVPTSPTAVATPVP